MVMQTQAQSRVRVESHPTFWRIEGTHYRGHVCTVDLLKELNYDGRLVTQDEAATLSEEAVRKGKFYTPNTQLDFAVKRTLFRGKDAYANDVEEAREFIKDNFRSITLTGVRHSLGRQNKVIHNYGTSHEFSYDPALVDPRQFVKDIKDARTLNAFFGTKNAKEVDETYRWIIGKHLILYRSNFPIFRDYVVSFDANSGRAVLKCNWGPDDLYDSFGVRIVRAQKMPKRRQR